MVYKNIYQLLIVLITFLGLQCAENNLSDVNYINKTYAFQLDPLGKYSGIFPNHVSIRSFAHPAATDQRTYITKENYLQWLRFSVQFEKEISKDLADSFIKFINENGKNIHYLGARVHREYKKPHKTIYLFDTTMNEKEFQELIDKANKELF